MKTAILELINGYSSFMGISKIIPLFLMAVTAVYILNIYESESKRRRINPAVFLLSIWSAIAYAMTLFTKKPLLRGVLTALFSLILIVYSGGFIFTKEVAPYSVYYYSYKKLTIACYISILAFLVIYYMISCQLFETISERLIFMGYILLLHMFAFYSEDAVRISLFMYPVSIPSVIIHDLMPLALWGYLLYENGRPKAVDDTSDNLEADDYEEEWDMKKHKILNIRNMAIALCIFAVVLIGCVYSLNSKINNLYNATVALEDATKGKVSMYEFIPDGKETAEATMVISGDGKITMYGSGGIENGQALYEFITEHTMNIDRWYLYGEDDDNRGAFDHCLNSGITVGKCYYMDVVEIN